MKTKFLILTIAILLLSPSVFAYKKAIQIDHEGTMQSAGTNCNASGTTAKIVCTVSTNCCYTVTIYVEVNSVHPNTEVEGEQEEFTEVILTADGLGTISGQLVYYDESPIPGGSVLDRMNTFLIIEGLVEQ